MEHVSYSFTETEQHMLMYVIYMTAYSKIQVLIYLVLNAEIR